MSEPYWITATPPTPNGDLHVGHLAGPYIAGDVLRRFLSAEGATVRYTTGLDDHQSYVPTRGLKDGGRKPEEVADGYGESITRVWAEAGVRFDAIGRPRTDAGYSAYVQNVFRKLYDDGHIVARDRPLPYCEPCGRWLYEAYVVGGCPHCGVDSNGNACEACGRPNHCGDLIDPRCVVCSAPAAVRDQERLFLPLAPFADRLVAFWDRVAMPPHLRALCERMLADGLPEIAVSHPADWGVPVPVDEFADQRVYVWFEMGPGYLLEHDPTGETLPTVAPVQFFGFDNGYFHALLFPVTFLAYHPDIALPRRFEVNEFYRLEGLKFSTSRRHAVWAHEALAEHGADVLRYHVLADRPTGRQTNYTAAGVALSRDRLHGWNSWIERLAGTVARECGGAVPDVPAGGPAWETLHQRLLRTVADLREAYSIEGFDPRRAVALLDEVVALAVDFGHVHEHEKDRPAGRRAYLAALTGQLRVAAALAAWAAPVLPDGAERLAALFGLPAGRPVDAPALDLPDGATMAAPAGPVFGA